MCNPEIIALAQKYVGNAQERGFRSKENIANELVALILRDLARTECPERDEQCDPTCTVWSTGDHRCGTR